MAILDLAAILHLKTFKRVFCYLIFRFNAGKWALFRIVSKLAHKNCFVYCTINNNFDLNWTNKVHGNHFATSSRSYPTLLWLLAAVVQVSLTYPRLLTVAKTSCMHKYVLSKGHFGCHSFKEKKMKTKMKTKQRKKIQT